MKNNWIKNLAIISLILIAAFSRLIPHPSNFTAVGALAIFGAYKISNKWLAVFIPLMAMWISDLLINNFIYSTYYSSFVFFSPGFIWIYLGIVAHSISGWIFEKNKASSSILGASTLGAMAFFILSNFGVWVGSEMYPKTFTGLTACFIAALPFFGNMLLGNLLFCALLFGSYYLLEKRSSLQTI